MDSEVVQRAGTWQLRRWCPYAETHQDADDRICGWDYCREMQKTHSLRLRRMLVCLTCQMGFFTVIGYERHECYSAY